MANLIRLKQIESGSALTTVAAINTDLTASIQNIVSQSLETSLSQSIVDIIVNNVEAVLPDGLISSSAQVNLISASGYSQLATDIEVATISSSLSSSISFLSKTYVTTASLNSFSSSIVSNINTISESLEGRVYALEQFSASLDQTFATDVEVSASQSQINIDMGEF